VPQGRSVDQSGFVLVRLEPLAQRLAQDGIAGGFDPSKGFPPVQRAIEALDQLIREADTGPEGAYEQICAAAHICSYAHAGPY
jgi:hypothetical protein